MKGEVLGIKNTVYDHYELTIVVEAPSIESPNVASQKYKDSIKKREDFIKSLRLGEVNIEYTE